MGSAWEQLGQLSVSKPGGMSVTEHQQDWLMQCLRRNAQTEYGQRYGFSSINTLDGYQQQVPMVSYDDIAEWMHPIQEGEEDILFSGRAIAFELTGGSSGGSKMIPYTHESFADFRRAIVPWLSQLVAHYDIKTGTAYFAISQVCRESPLLSSGIPVGMSDGAYLGEDVQQILANLMATPPWLASIEKVDEWQLATLYYLIQARDLTLVSVWSPTFFSVLLDAIEVCAERLLALYQYGGKLSLVAVSPDPDSFQRLRDYLHEGQTAILWPQLKLVSCWADASSRPYYTVLKQRLAHAQFQAKGLLATEGVVTVPNTKGVPCLALDSGFFEFVDSTGSVHLCDGLHEGEVYELVITTAGGLYRYRTGDQVLYQGLSDTLPVLRFAGRGGLQSDMVGEKLSDEFVTQCLEELPGFRMLVPLRAPRARYVLLIEHRDKEFTQADLSRVEEKLLANPQYAYARRIGQLGRLEVLAFDAPLQRYIETMQAQGVRLGDIKVPALGSQAPWVRYVESII